MIAFIKGIIHSYNKDSLIIENNGIGYRIYISNPQTVSLNKRSNALYISACSRRRDNFIWFSYGRRT